MRQAQPQTRQELPECDPRPGTPVPPLPPGTGSPTGGGYGKLQRLRSSASGNHPGTGHAGDDGLEQLAPLRENSKDRIVLFARRTAVFSVSAENLSGLPAVLGNRGHFVSCNSPVLGNGGAARVAPEMALKFPLP